MGRGNFPSTPTHPRYDADGKLKCYDLDVKKKAKPDSVRPKGGGSGGGPPGRKDGSEKGKEKEAVAPRPAKLTNLNPN